jgi:hypothetical protein
MKRIEDVRARLRGEFLEMPGLRLKAQQVQRLCGVEQVVCQEALDVLVAEKFLSLHPDGHYSRVTSGSLHSDSVSSISPSMSRMSGAIRSWT